MADSFSSSSSSAESSPFAPQFINQAGDTANQLKQSAISSAAQQQERLHDYISHLYKVRDLAKRAAASAAARGKAGNPVAQFQAMQELANQAGIPIDAEIAKAMQGSNSIENTMNQLLANAGQLQASLGSIMKHTQSSSSFGQQTTGGSSSSTRSRPQPNSKGSFIPIRGPLDMGGKGGSAEAGIMPEGMFQRPEVTEFNPNTVQPWDVEKSNSPYSSSDIGSLQSLIDSFNSTAQSTPGNHGLGFGENLLGFKNVEMPGYTEFNPNTVQPWDVESVSQTGQFPKAASWSSSPEQGGGWGAAVEPVVNAFQPIANSPLMDSSWWTTSFWGNEE